MNKPIAQKVYVSLVQKYKLYFFKPKILVEQKEKIEFFSVFFCKQKEKRDNKSLFHLD